MINVPPYLTHYFMIFKWRECIEIGLFVFCFYSFAVWLHRDQTKKLFPLFLSFCTIFLLSDFLALTTLNNFLLYFCPLFLMLFVLAHQSIIQRNFVTAKNITPAQVDSWQWIQELVKSMVFGFSNNKNLLCIIEHNDSLEQFIHNGIVIDTFLNKDLLNTLLMSSLWQEQTITYITKTGILKGINGRIADIEFNLEQETLEEQKAAILATKTDCIYIKTDSPSRTFSITIQAKVMEHLTAAQTLSILETYYKKNKMKDESYESSKKNSINKQPYH